MSGSQILTDSASKYIENILRPYLYAFSYIEGTRDFFNKLLDLTISDDVFLASLEIEALYSKIRNALGL